MSVKQEIDVVRELAYRVAAIAADEVQEERRRLWSDHFSLKPTRPPLLFTFGQWNYWCRDTFGNHRMQCQDPLLRNVERTLRQRIFHHEVGDDFIQDPWYTLGAVKPMDWGNLWGLPANMKRLDQDGSAGAYAPPLQDWDDLDKLTPYRHVVDEEATAVNLAKVHDAIGEIMKVAVDRTPVLQAFLGDISTEVAKLRGLAQIMLDMYEEPEQLHRLLAFLRDAVLRCHQDAEDAGHFTLISHNNQAMPYCDELEWPSPNAGPRKRKQLWGFLAAQEYTLVSPAFHDEFLLQYQLPIMENFGLMHYGCCEDLGEKIGLLRSVPNLRSIAVTPVADVRRCAEQIGMDYALSWRPNPTDMVSGLSWNGDGVRRIIRNGLEACKGQCLHLHLKDVETVGDDLTRPARWVNVVREVIDRVW